jgi:xanthine dehydrogenase molybdenum-binding subunit
MEGHDIRTLEGMPDDLRRTIGEAFVLEGGVQCGFCIPGIVVRAASLIEHGKTDDRETIAKALDGHICRCTGYGRIIDAIQTAGEMCRNGGKLPQEPRRHDYFGEQFGLKRNPAVAGGHGNADGIGRSVPRQGGVEQTLGQKPFVDDLRVPGMLHGAMVLTAHPRAKILGIDTSGAEAMPGVVRVFTARDVTGFRGVGLTDPDQPLFVAEGEVTCCVADFLAMVVADTQFHARQAAQKVTVDYEVYEPITDPFEAMRPGTPLVHSDQTFAPRPSNTLEPVTSFARGDVDAALKTATHVIEHTWQTQPVDSWFPASGASRCSPTARDRRMTSNRLPGSSGWSGPTSKFRSSPAAVRSAPRKSCRFRRTQRWRPGRSADPSRRYSLARSRPSITSSGTR